MKTCKKCGYSEIKEEYYYCPMCRNKTPKSSIEELKKVKKHIDGNINVASSNCGECLYINLCTATMEDECHILSTPYQVLLKEVEMECLDVIENFKQT